MMKKMLHTILSRRWCDQGNVRQALLRSRTLECPCLLWGQVHNDETVHTCCSAVLHKGILAVHEEGVVVSHQHQRHFYTRSASFLDDVEALVNRLEPILQGSLVGSLDGGAISKGISEGNPKFYDISTAFFQRFNNFHSFLSTRVPNGGVRNECRPPFGLAFPEGLQNGASPFAFHGGHSVPGPLRDVLGARGSGGVRRKVPLEIPGRPWESGGEGPGRGGAARSQPTNRFQKLRSSA
mmetsp:Transcript_35971/g.69871  ORF Transcript_35971/g.69871 Transcript_35971/m.69871 type:complete len:238 (+) Transcript_35971:1954-2667(+)